MCQQNAQIDELIAKEKQAEYELCKAKLRRLAVELGYKDPFDKSKPVKLAFNVAACTVDTEHLFR